MIDGREVEEQEKPSLQGPREAPGKQQRSGKCAGLEAAGGARVSGREGAKTSGGACPAAAGSALLEIDILE